MLLVVWDDWGGWYDHINPITTIGQNNIGYPGGNGNGVPYVYGFRVPLLVVSAYARQRYISGALGNTIYYHDFGSILRFIEEEFLPRTLWGEIDPSYPYADAFAGGNSLTPDDLSDFFQPQYQTFPGPITVHDDSSLCSSSTCSSCQQGQTCHCDAACFITYKGNPKDPDTD